MSITPRLSDALAAARHAAAQAAVPAHELPPSSSSSSALSSTAAGIMAPLSMTPLAPPRPAGIDQSTDQSTATPPRDSLPGAVPTARRELFDRTREHLLDLVSRRDVSALPPSWAGVSGRLSQEEAASATAALQLVAARVSP